MQDYKIYLNQARITSIIKILIHLSLKQPGTITINGQSIPVQPQSSSDFRITNQDIQIYLDSISWRQANHDSKKHLTTLSRDLEKPYLQPTRYRKENTIIPGAVSLTRYQSDIIINEVSIKTNEAQDIVAKIINQVISQIKNDSILRDRRDSTSQTLQDDHHATE